MPDRRRAFTLVEAMVSALLVAVGIVAVFGGIRAIARAEDHARTAELLQRLAAQKLDEMGPVTDPRTAEDDGDFSDDGYPDIRWNLATETTDDPDVQQLTVEATRDQQSQRVTGLVWLRPATTEAAAGATP